MSWAHPRWLERWPTPLAVGVATLGPLGRLGPGPGTLGTLAGLVFFLLVLTRLPGIGQLAVAVVLAWVAVGLCGEAEKRLGRKDPGCVILDEFIAVPWCFLGWRHLEAVVPAWVVFTLGFALFRFFDIAKPLGIRALQDLPGGWGVVVDDLAAALATCLVLHLGIRLYGVWP